MNTKNPIANNSCNGKIIKGITNTFPEFNIKFSFNFIVETIYFIDFRTLMISPEHKEIIGMLDLVGHKKTETL